MVRTAGFLVTAGLALGALTAAFAGEGEASMLDRVEIIAHRGASHDAPENTRASVLLGWEQGADAVEVDVMLTRDGRIVAMHDSTTKRTAGRDLAIRQHTWEALRVLDVGRWKGERFAGEPIPLLEDLLATIPAGRRMVVEIKTGPEIVPVLERVVAASGKQPEQIAFISFNYFSCVGIKRARPEHEVYLLSGFERNGDAWRPTFAELVRGALGARLDGLDVHWRGPLTPENCARVRDAGLKLAVYTCDDPIEAKRLIEAGVTSITTNRPGWMREQLGTLAAREVAQDAGAAGAVRE